MTPPLLFTSGIRTGKSWKKTSDNEEEKTFAKQQLGTPSEGEASILGLAWSKDKDELKAVVTSGEATTTKRGILSKLAQIYDPLGLLSPRTLQGKIIYCEVCNKKIQDGMLSYLLSKGISGLNGRSNYQHM